MLRRQSSLGGHCPSDNQREAHIPAKPDPGEKLGPGTHSKGMQPCPDGRRIAPFCSKDDKRRRSVLADYKRLARILGMDGATERIARHMYTLQEATRVPRYRVYTTTPLGNFQFSANGYGKSRPVEFEDNYNLKGFYKSGELMDPEEPKPPILFAGS